MGSNRTFADLRRTDHDKQLWAGYLHTPLSLGMDHNAPGLWLTKVFQRFGSLLQFCSGVSVLRADPN